MTNTKLTLKISISYCCYLRFYYFGLWGFSSRVPNCGNDSNLLIVFYVQIMPDDFVMQLHRF
ncbi:hypothetical protein AWP91_28450 [Escherichia coli]|nr:hypothetical protein AWP91_28450 [Escherichia coli]